MSLVVRLGNLAQNVIESFTRLEFIAPLLLRLYLAPIFWMAGTRKLADMESTIAWFGNAEWGLGLPFPEFLAWAATLTEVFGAIFLLLGLAVRWVSIPLMVTMVVAAVTVHWQNGWLAIAEGADSLFATERTVGGIERLDRARSILQEHGNYDWLTENGSLAILNNGIEFAATYFIMLMGLLMMGAGRYLSVDYWIARRYRTGFTAAAS